MFFRARSRVKHVGLIALWALLPARVAPAQETAPAPIAAPTRLHVAVAPARLPDEASADLHSGAMLFETVLQTRLLEAPLIDLVDRQATAALLKEFELNAAVGGAKLQVGKWAGADVIVRSDCAPDKAGAAAQLNWQILTSGQTGIHEAQGHAVVDPKDPATWEAAAADVAKALVAQAPRFLARNRARVLLSVTGVSHNLALSRADWLAAAVERTVLAEAQQTPGLVLLERRELDDVYKEYRLRAGALIAATGPKPLTVEKYLALSGKIAQVQPTDGPWVTELTLEATDLSTGMVAARQIIQCQGSAFDALLVQVPAAFAKLLDVKGPAAPTTAAQRAAEALKLIKRVVEMGRPEDTTSDEAFYQKVIHENSDFWTFSVYAWFKPWGAPYYKSSARQALIRKALALAQAAAMLSEDPVAQSLMAQLLVDRDIGREDEGRALAYEAAQRGTGTEHGKKALHFLATRWKATHRFEPAALPLVADYVAREPGAFDVAYALRALADPKFPDLPGLTGLAQATVKNQAGLPIARTALIDETLMLLGPYCLPEWSGLDKTAWPQFAKDPANDLALAAARQKAEPLLLAIYDFKGGFLSVDQPTPLALWFAATQAIGVGEPPNVAWVWRDPKVRAHGQDVVHRLLELNPNMTFIVAGAWSDMLLTTQSRTGRPGEAVPSGDVTEAQILATDWRLHALTTPFPASHALWPSPGDIGTLTRSTLRWLLHAQRWDDALLLLDRAPVTNETSTRQMRTQVYLEMGDWTHALALLEAQGRAPLTLGGKTRPAQEWADDCRLRLAGDATRPASATRLASPLAGVKAHWANQRWPLPPGSVTAMALVGNEIWVGLSERSVGPDDEGFRSPMGMVIYPWYPKAGTPQPAEGGLVRIRPDDNHADVVPLGADGIPGIHVSSIVVTPERVYVGFFKEGLAIFDRAAGKWSMLNADNGLPSNNINALAADSKHLWISYGRNGQGGLASLELGANQVHLHPADEKHPGASPPPGPADRLTLADGLLWAGKATSPKRQQMFVYDIKAERWQMVRVSDARTLTMHLAASVPAATGPPWTCISDFYTISTRQCLPEQWADLPNLAHWHSVPTASGVAMGNIRALLPVARQLAIIASREVFLYDPASDAAVSLAKLDRSADAYDFMTTAVWDGQRLWIGHVAGGVAVLQIDGIH